MNRPTNTRTAGRKTLANSLVALSSAAVIAVYAAGYARTAPVAGQFVATETVPGGDAGASPAPVPTTTPTAVSAATAAPTSASNSAGQEAQRGGRQQPGVAGSGGASATPIATATATTTAVATVTTSATTVVANASTATPAATTGAFRDGTYTGIGTSRHGNIGVTVTVQAGKIVAAEITTCGTRYPCSIIAALPGQAVARQSAAVDAVSGATDSTTAYRAAVNAALAQAR